MKIICKHYGLNYFGQVIGGVLFVPKITQCMCNSSFRVYYKLFGFHHISIETWRGIAKPYQILERKQYPIRDNLQK